MRGIAKNWNGDRGFGFIQPDDGGEDVFCHVSEIVGTVKSLQPGQQVQYDIGEDRRVRGRTRAVRVRTV